MRSLFRRNKKQQEISNPQARPLSIGRAPSLLLPSPSFMGYQRNIAEKVGQNKIVNTEQLEAMRRALEQSAMNALSSRSSSDPIGLRNELESRRDGTGDAPPRYLNHIERRGLEYANANIQALIEDIVDKSKTTDGLHIMEMEVAELGQKHHNLTATEKWKMRKMMYYIGNTPNRGIGGEQKQSYRRSYSPLDEPAAGDFQFDGYLPNGEGYNDLGGGRRKKRKTKKRKSKKKKTKKKKTRKRRRKKQKTNKRKRRKYKKKSTRKR